MRLALEMLARSMSPVRQPSTLMPLSSKHLQRRSMRVADLDGREFLPAPTGMGRGGLWKSGKSTRELKRLQAFKTTKRSVTGTTARRTWSRLSAPFFVPVTFTHTRL